MKIRKKIAEYLLKIPFVYKAISEEADLSAFWERPAKHIMIKNFFGLFLILFSYALGWPVVLILGVISISTREPLFVVIGGPIAYGISHLVFWIGMYITGAYYTMIFLRWAVRMAVEKFAGSNEIASAMKGIKNNADN